ncbi:hypothetical protein EAX62_04330 [Tessaracoccus antarcticus]|uniref:DUF4352 domain-containing protein n=2 Tax=Tessaracoccus antarcticus TaxID=2479848 RepID=A0A3M0GL16_9ACTN|nr:hypothetical protein EAX62_04330 [Tessaracoccus antarcticus]
MPWVVTITLLVCALAAIALTGGFGRNAAAFVGSEYDTDATISTRLWDVSVEGAEMSHEDGTVRVHIVATNKQLDSARDLTTNMLVVILPDDTAMWRSSCFPVDRSSFGPEVPTRAVCEFDYERNDVPAPAVAETMDVRVVVCDQTMTDALIHVPTPEAGEPVGWVGVTATAVVDQP